MCAYPTAVLLVASPSLHRQGLLATLHDAWPDLPITLQLDAAELPRMLYQHAYAVLVLDCALPTEPLLPFLESLYTIRSGQPVVLLTGNRLSTSLRQFLADRDTHTCLPHHAAPATVLSLFQSYLLHASSATAGQPMLPHRTLAPPTPFSRRELEVLRLVVHDYCNQEIADHLCLSVRTVESHRRALLQKAGARTLVGLAVQAVREGWVTT
ncbi:response regulator transcription factor [Hymenobacter seoulensis]